MYLQHLTISKKWKNLSSPLHRNGNLVQVVLWFLTCSLGLPALGTDLKSRKGLYSGPFPLQNAHWSRHSMFWNDTHVLLPFFFPVSTHCIPIGCHTENKRKIIFDVVLYFRWNDAGSRAFLK
jgi:hypothetical protein